jgi:hypothetical protein
VRSASLLQSRYADLPSLDFKGKKKEINGLLNEIARDTKRATIRERSNREELLEEIMGSILTWLNDIWTVVYEGKVFFREAHACLLFLAEVLSTLNSTPGIGGSVTRSFLDFVILILCTGVNASAVMSVQPLRSSRKEKPSKRFL